MCVKLLTEHHFEFLSLKAGCTGSSESTLVKMSNCWKSHVAAQMFFVLFFVFCCCCCLAFSTVGTLISELETSCSFNNIHYSKYFITDKFVFSRSTRPLYVTRLKLFNFTFFKF